MQKVAIIGAKEANKVQTADLLKARSVFKELKNKVLFSMNFLTNFGLTSNTKSCAIFNSECMLVFAAYSLLFRENQVKKHIHRGPL